MSTVIRYLRAMAKLALGRGVHKSYAHQGEDVVIEGMLKWVKNGTYVDVGAYHPVLYSNTYAFYNKGWSGIVIDPNIDMKPLYTLMRPRDTFVHTAVGPVPEEKPYYMFDDGAYNSFDEGRAKSWKATRGLDIKEVRTISFKPLSQILREQNITHIDFLNVDVEGLDLEVLKTHDWSIPTRVVAVEDETFNPDTPRANAIYAYMHDQGYVLAGLAGLTLLFLKPKEKTV
jgi:FkbM family methyltransferase